MRIRTHKKDKLNIAMIGQKHVPSLEGGIEVVVEALSVRMVEMGHNVTCFNRMVQDNASGVVYHEMLSEYKGVKLKYVPTVNKRGAATAIYTLLATVRAAFENYDVVHFHAEGPAFMCWLPKLMGKRVVVTIHGLDHQRQKWGSFSSWCIRCGEKKAVKYADKIIVLSRNLQRYFKENYNRDTVYIPNGVDAVATKGPELIKEKYGLDKDGYILFLGRVVPEKGLDYLIEAYKQIDTDKRLIIAGGSYDAWDYENVIKLKAESDSRIEFIGFVDGQIKQELLSNAYVFVLPSNLEGMPMALLEAMTYGNCAIVSNIPECTEVVGDKAVVFKKGDSEDLKEKLEGLLKDSKLVHNIREHVAEYILKKHNWNEVTTDTIAVYNSIHS